MQAVLPPGRGHAELQLQHCNGSGDACRLVLDPWALLSLPPTAALLHLRRWVQPAEV